MEKLHFAPQKGKLSALQCKQSDELAFLFPEYAEYCQTISLNVYDTREIFCEKVRSILTREGFKARDFLDVYLICKKYDLKLEDLLESIVDKVRFALGMYRKYQENFEAKKAVLASEPFRWGEEKRFLLQDIDGTEFEKFLDNFQLFLKKVIDR